MKYNSHKNGFTMIEALLSSLILAVGAVVICDGWHHRVFEVDGLTEEAVSYE